MVQVPPGGTVPGPVAVTQSSLVMAMYLQFGASSASGLYALSTLSYKATLVTVMAAEVLFAIVTIGLVRTVIFTELLGRTTPFT